MSEARPRSRSRRARATSGGEWRTRSALSQNSEADEAVISRQLGSKGRQQHGLYAEHLGPLRRGGIESQNALCSDELAHLARDADIGSGRGCIASRKSAAGARLDHTKIEGSRGQPSSRIVESGTIPRSTTSRARRSSRSARAANGRQGRTHREEPAP
eukprot:6479246-Amphidinium_carterae.1